jgi:two-component system LytT family sensor kinase
VKNKKAWLEIAAWAVLYLIWLLLFQNHAFSFTKTMTVQFCYLIFITADYYFIERILIPRYLPKRKYSHFVGFILGLILVSSGLRALLALQMNLHFFRPAVLPQLSTLYLNSVINISLWVLLILTFKMILDKRQTHKKIDLLEQERVKSELAFLKAQINPHALFNSLNTIYGNIDKSNGRARDTLLQFSELLRYQLYDCHAEKVCLGKEIDYIKNYISFHRLRKNDELQIHFCNHDIEKDLTIAPLLLVVLVENAFKFVSNASCRENLIRIVISAKDQILFCRVHNTTEAAAYSGRAEASGIGLANLKRRLELLYPQKHSMVTNRTMNFYETELTIQLA